MHEILPSPPFVLFDDSLAGPDEAGSLLLSGLERIIKCGAVGELDQTLDAIETAAASGYHVAVTADYELAYWMEPRSIEGTWFGAHPLLTAYVFAAARSLTGKEVGALLAAHAAALPPRRRIAGVADLQPGLGESDYLAGVRRILDYIRAGDCYQVDYTFALRFRHFGDPIALYAALRTKQPVQFGACLSLPERTILSLSPELFVERCGDRLTTRPMKGTACRHADPVQDAANREALAASLKNRAENVMIVDLIRNDLGRIARPGSVHVDHLFQVEAYPTLWQMTSTVSADASGATLAQIFRALFPCGSVTGAPKIRAMQIAAELEAGARGIYTGAIGYVRPGGDFRFNVPIRTLCLEADGTGSLGLGSGIVADSEPENELIECRLKSRFVTDIEAGFQLIETMLLDPLGGDRCYPLLAEHLARLSDSARYFGFACPIDRLSAALLEHARSFGDITLPRRVRLLLDKSGEFSIQSTALSPDLGDLGIVLSSQVSDSHDIFRRHKTTMRHHFDAELDRLAAHPEIFDAIFCNERGELCEGARSNIFLRIDGILHTPPPAAGLLNGVMRRHLMRQQAGAIVESTLHPSDLQRADAIYLSNAVRGFRRAQLVAIMLQDARLVNRGRTSATAGSDQ